MVKNMKMREKAYISGRISSQPWGQVKKAFAFGCKYAEAAQSTNLLILGLLAILFSLSSFVIIDIFYMNT